MRGVILAGGTGSRLGCTDVNKHVFPVGDRPMVRWPLQVLLDNGVTDVTVVSTPSGVGQIAKVLGSGSALGCSLSYRVQEEPSGVAAALKCAPARGQESIAVILGDNVFLPSPNLVTPVGAHCYIHAVERDRLSAFGVPSFDAKSIRCIVEKPADPPSGYAVTGLYVFGPEVFRNLELLRPGARGEYEVTDLLDGYAKRGRLTHTTFFGFWGDAGTPEGLAECRSHTENL